jgi:hypothetical protein
MLEVKLYIDNKEIASKENIKILEIILDLDLHFKEYIVRIAKREVNIVLALK